MTRLISPLLLASLMASTHGFTPMKPSTGTVPYFASVLPIENDGADGVVGTPVLETESQIDMAVEKKPAPKKKVAKKAGGHNQEGLMSPFVILSKKVLGDAELNKLRGKVIALHSKVIGNFVETAQTGFGDQVLRQLFELADTNKNGTIEEEELAEALKSLGFSHLKEKQIKGIFARADLDSDGGIDYEEWKKEAPSTLRTNLVKLAKKNGGDLGFLS
jgi:hypothetical protein